MSDGISDVMENLDVINFIEKFRNQSAKNISEIPDTSDVATSNTVIA
jgi:hypothetical protein